MSELDPVRRVLADRGCPDDIVSAGLGGLLDRWATVVGSVEEGYAFGLDDFLNDMDLRDALEAALAVTPPTEGEPARERLAPLDARLHAASTVTGCLWGTDVEEEDGLTPGREWWYYLRPARLNDDFAGELEAWGLLHDGGESA